MVRHCTILYDIAARIPHQPPVDVSRIRALTDLLLRYPLAGVVRQIALIPDQIAPSRRLKAQVQPILHERPAVALWALMA
jgi:hypothetical protein